MNNLFLVISSFVASVLAVSSLLDSAGIKNNWKLSISFVTSVLCVTLMILRLIVMMN